MTLEEAIRRSLWDVVIVAFVDSLFVLCFGLLVTMFAFVGYHDEVERLKTELRECQELQECQGLQECEP